MDWPARCSRQSSRKKHGRGYHLERTNIRQRAREAASSSLSMRWLVLTLNQVMKEGMRHQLARGVTRHDHRPLVVHFRGLTRVFGWSRRTLITRASQKCALGGLVEEIRGGLCHRRSTRGRVCQTATHRIHSRRPQRAGHEALTQTRRLWYHCCQRGHETGRSRRSQSRNRVARKDLRPPS